MSRTAEIVVEQPVELARSQVRLGPEIFRSIFSLTEKQPWLKDKQTPLFELIDECSNKEQEVLICELLHRFVFLDDNDFRRAVQKIADYIEVTLNLSARNCSIVASENGKSSDSSQLVVYSLKNAIWKSQEWNTISFVSNLSHLTESPSKDNIVIVDEFIGTGETAEKKISWIRDRFSKLGQNPNLYFAVIAGMKSGLSRVSNCVDGMYSVYELSKGISDAYPLLETIPKIKTMGDLESSLGAEGRRGKLSKHSFGYKKSEALYSRSGGNTPNNVFPIFWWETRKNGSPRSTLLTCM